MTPLEELLPRYFELNGRIRDEKTRKQYRLAVADFARYLGRRPVVRDLTDDHLTGLSYFLTTTRKHAPRTANERVGRLATLWSWLTKRGEASVFPTYCKIPEPQRVPVAWTREQLDTLLRSFQRVRGRIAGIRARSYWTCLHLILWETGERISAVMQLRWEHLDGNWLVVPSELRKNRRQEMAYRLTPETVCELESIRAPLRDLLFPWPYSKCYLWARYRKLREYAGLSTDRRSSFHRIRRSVASHAKAAGGDPSDLLGHADRRTAMSYIDPRIAPPPQPTDYLFRIG